MTAPVLDALNKFLGMGFALREAIQMSDRALGLKPGTSRAVLVGGAS